MSIDSPDVGEQRGAGLSPDFYATLGLGLDTRQGIAYAGVQAMIAKHCPDAMNAIDYGCGPGRSTRFLKQCGIERVVGVDINPTMLTKAMEQELPSGVSYQKVKSGALPFQDNTFALAFSGLVLLEISRADDVRKVLEELRRVTAHEGTIIVLTCTKAGYVTDSDDFKCLLTGAQKHSLKDGDPVPTRFTKSGKKFDDYFWSDAFLRTAFQDVGLTLVEVHLPVPTPEQRRAAPKLTDEPHYVIYVCKKLGYEG